MFSIHMTFILLLSCLPFIGADLYVPSIVAMAHYFGTSVDMIQFSLSFLMFGIAGGQFIYGPLSEGYGRKPPILVGVLLAMLGCLLCVFAKTLPTLFLGQLVQGLGLGVGSLFRSILRDQYSGKELTIRGGQLSILNTFILTSAPMMGGFLQTTFNWQACFIFFFFYNCLVWIVAYFVYEESNEHRHIDRLAPAYVFRVYSIILAHRAFSGYCLCTFLTMFAYFAWLSIFPVIMIKQFSYSPLILGQIMLLCCFFAFMFGALVNNYLVVRASPKVILSFGWSLMLLSGLVLAGSYFLVGLFAYTLIACLTLFIMGTAFLWPNFFAFAFTPFHETAGYAGALYGGTQIAGGFFSAFLVSFMSESTPIPLATCIILSTVVAWGYYLMVIHPFEQQRLEEEAG